MHRAPRLQSTQSIVFIGLQNPFGYSFSIGNIVKANIDGGMILVDGEYASHDDISIIVSYPDLVGALFTNVDLERVVALHLV